MTDSLEFVICARSRTGSNLLVSLLASHPDIECRHEELRRLNGANLEDRVRHAFRTWPSVKAAGFKWFYYHPVDGDADQAFSAIFGRPGVKAIHLTRRNLLELALSEAVARRTDAWVDKPNNAAQGADPISLPIKTVRDCHDITIAFETRLRERLVSLRVPTLEIEYEALGVNPRATAQRIFDFLEVRTHEAQSDVRKQETRTLKRAISNYSELRAAPELRNLARIVWD